MPSPRSASAFSSFTTICSGVCFENFLMVIHSARPQAAGTTQNNPLTTNGPKNPDPSKIKTYDEKNILKKEKDQLLETLHTKMIGSIAADSNAEMNRVNAELYPDGSRKVCP